MKSYRHYRKGYSIVEMILATVLVISLSAVSYRVLKTLTMTQATNVTAQKSNKAAQVALDRFKKDMSMVDYNWVRYGIASIYPHPGYGFGTNYYVNVMFRNTEKLNDGITFLRRDPANDKIYDVMLSKKLCYPAAQTVADQDLYGTGIQLSSVAGLQQGDWVLIYQGGKYSIGLIAQLNGNSITMAPPPLWEQQHIPQINGISAGYVFQPGVVPANMDFNGDVTLNIWDDSFCFDLNAPKVQKIASPISYVADYRTTDGDHKSAQNSYVLDKNGDKEKMLVRIEYENVTVKREYIAAIDQVEFSYDLLKPEDTTLPGGILRNVGHEKDTQVLALLSNTDPTSTDLYYETSSKIVAVNMNLRLVNDGKNLGDKDWIQAEQLKVAIDPSLKEDLYQDHMSVESTVTKNLDTIPPHDKAGSTFNEQLGKPLYLGNVPGSEEVLVPVNTFEMDTQGNMGPASAGIVYVYSASTDPLRKDDVGCPVNHLPGNCQVNGPMSTLNFTLSSGKTFFPSAITQTMLPDGTTRIVIGGIGMDMANGIENATRQPVLATIVLGRGESLEGQLAQYAQQQTDMGAPCSIPNCQVQEIDNTVSNLHGLVDTANVSIDPSSGDVYVATMTKEVGEDSPSSIYKGIWNGSGFNYAKLADVPDSSDGRIVSAIGDRLMTIGGRKYLAVGLTKKISCKNGNGIGIECLNDINGAIPGTDDPNDDVYGRIELIKDDGTQIVLMNHNYRTASITVDNNNNLIIAGRLSVQMIPAGDIRNALTNPQFLADMQKKVLYLDEVGKVENGKPYFADYFTVDSNTYKNKVPQDIGWMGGISMYEYPDGTLGMVDANKYRLDPGATSVTTTNNTAHTREFSNVGIEKISLAGMQDRVVATIETNPTNINASVITATYNAAVSEVPPTYLPGIFRANGVSGATRTTPTPLPFASPSMSDMSWIELYRQMISSTGNQGVNQGMPTIGTTMVDFDCKHTSPKCTY